MTCVRLRVALLAAGALLLACGPAPLREVRPGTDTHRWYQDAQLEKLLNEETASTLIGGNAVELLVNGDVAFAKRYANLEDATFILIKTFIWTDDAAGRELADAVVARARADVPVIVQYDVKGNIGSLADVQDMLSRVSRELPVGEPKIFADLREAGVFVVATNSPGRPYELEEWVQNTKRLFRDPGAALRRSWESLVLFDHVDHDKYFITGHGNGEVRAIVGGLNIASEYALGGVPDRKDPGSGRGGWRDTDLQIRGPGAVAVANEFLKDLERHLPKPPPEEVIEPIRRLLEDSRERPGTTNLRFVTNNPLFGEKGRIDRAFRILILATPRKEHIFLSTPYFAPSKELRAALVKHMEGGGWVTVLTNSRQSSDIGILTDASRYCARELMRAGRFRLYERIPRPDLGERMLHQKVASFGRYGPMVIGSANLDAQSFVHNGEALVVVQDRALRAAFDAMVATDMAPDRARRVTVQELETPAVTKRLRQFVAGEFAWYWL